MKTSRMKETLLAKKIKKEDPIELPMDEKFYENMHNQIMLAVEKTEIKPPSRWAKTWVFLEASTIRSRVIGKKIIKTSIVGLIMATTVSLFSTSGKTYSDVKQAYNTYKKANASTHAGKSVKNGATKVEQYYN
jgi:hypothetical protein